MREEYKVNKDNVLLGLDGTYNEEIHTKLSRIIHNIAYNKTLTNPSVSLEDLKQEAWCRIFDVIKKNLANGRELEISYLISVAQSMILGCCIVNQKYNKGIDVGQSAVLNSYSVNEDFDVRQALGNLEYMMSKNKTNEMDSSCQRIALEQILESTSDKRVKYMIVMRYIKDCNGTSKKIKQMYDEFYNELDEDKQNILNNMTKFTNNEAYKVLGMRATDNSSTKVRANIRNILSVLV